MSEAIIPHPRTLEKQTSKHELMRNIDEEGDPPSIVVSTRKNNKTTPLASNPTSPPIKPASPTTTMQSTFASSPPHSPPYPEPYSVPPALSPPIVNSLDKKAPSSPSSSASTIVPPRPFPAPKKSIVHRILHPPGVSPKHKKYEHWVGRIGFGAKGLVYSFVGGMTCASATKLTGETNGSPQGAFILIGDFPAGNGLLVVMLLSLACYVVWRWWECFTFQGADATFSPFKNFFAYRLSPFISGCVYIAYGYYIIQILANENKPTCYPECWRHSVLGKIGLVLFGTAFAIACLTQLLNVFTRKWHPEIEWTKCNKYEKWTLLILGHAGFLGRSGLFVFVSILMFRALRGTVHQGGNTIANGINQFIGTGAGRTFMFIFGFLTLMYGVFALLCTRYRYFPTPPPSGIPLYYRHSETEVREAELARQAGGGVGGERGGERGERGERGGGGGVVVPGGGEANVRAMEEGQGEFEDEPL